MTETDHGKPQSTGTPSPGRYGPRRTRGLRFSDSEWEEIKAAAEGDGLNVSEFVRDRLLAIVRGNAAAGSAESLASLAPLIERTFRYTWFLATRTRDEMLQEGCHDEVDELVRQARELQDRLQQIELRQVTASANGQAAERSRTFRRN
ncbi:MAG: hypothetical protein F4051_13050 [Boseongicola sp. SB0670_bin_30]|nr:hypothetical protein [Boseongicola sp. SB0670_bin_30]